jgi:hypothetical protein
MCKLQQDGKIIQAESPKWDIEHDDIPTSPPSIHHASPVQAFGHFDASSDVASPSPSRKPRKSEPTARPAKSMSKPRKSMGDQIAEVLSASREAQIAASEARIQARLTLEDRKIDNIQKVEQMRIDFQHEQELRLQQDREATRQHELLMIDKQIELERLQRGFAPPVIDPSL